MFTIPLGMIKNQSISTINISLSNSTLVYNGNNQSITITPSNTSVSYNINGTAGTGIRTYSEINQGVYTVLLQSNDSNYELDTTTTTFTITPATLTLTITGDETQTHTGSPLTRTITPSVTTSDNANSIEYIVGRIFIYNGTEYFWGNNVTTGVSSVGQSNVGSYLYTLSSNDSNYVTNISRVSIIIESGSTSYTYYKFVIPSSGPTRIDYIKFMTASGSIVPTTRHAYSPTSLSKWRSGNPPSPHQESGEGWFLNNESHYYVFKNSTSNDITNYDLKMISHTNRMPQRWQIYGSNTNGNWNYIKQVPTSGTFSDGSNSNGNRTRLRYHYENGNKWFKSEVLPAITGSSSHASYLGQPLNSNHFEIN
jgi:hypothetical protein